VRRTVERLVAEADPDLVGLSVMTFQRVTARRIISLIRSLKPAVRIAVGGYDPSLAPVAWMDPELGVDFIVRGEGEITFRDLLRAIEGQTPLRDVPGLLFRDGPGFQQGPPRPVAPIADDVIRLPNRAARALAGYTMLGRQVDVVETSRGCTFDCSFCSIIEMRGRNFHCFPIARVIEDIADAYARGARAIFLVDDNITIDVPRFEALCRAIVDAGLNTIDYIVQGMTSAIAAHGEHLVPLMRKAGIRYVFLGIENVLADDLAFLKASAKNRKRSGGVTSNAAITAVDLLHRHGLLVVGGLIVGNPDDTPAAIAANLAFARKYVDWPYIQHPTPYPGTPMTRDLVAAGLVVNPRVEEYDGTTAVVRNAHLSSSEIEFIRWKAERWIKVRHLPAVLRHDPMFVVTNGRRMLAHTFRGTTWRSVAGLENAQTTFARYCEIRRREREYVDWPDPLARSRPETRSQPATATSFGIPVNIAGLSEHRQVAPGKRVPSG
ncbi:MAG TPA: radical SAM protein, partial [Vicinamibacterales bacterium]|nr:radical SAM protein [Vicinamibacterales bacterium]